MGRDGGQQLRLIEVKALAELEPESPAGEFGVGKAELEDGCGLAVEVAALRDGDEKQAGLGCGCFNGEDKSGLHIGGHSRGILISRSVHSHSK